jgi:hypothetical protein
VLLAGVAASAAVLAGIPIAGAVAAGGLAWVGRVWLGLPRAQRRDDINPNRLVEPWKRFVQDALNAERHYSQAARACRPGPLRDRLDEIGRRIDEGVTECWRIAQRGQALTRAMRSLDVPAIERDLDEAKQGRWASEADRGRTVDALQAQLDSAHRILHVAEDARDRLRLLNARLDEAVARAVELSLQADDAAALTGLGADIDAIVGDMESLRQALEVTAGTAPAGGAS